MKRSYNKKIVGWPIAVWMAFNLAWFLVIPWINYLGGLVSGPFFVSGSVFAFELWQCLCLTILFFVWSWAWQKEIVDTFLKPEPVKKVPGYIDAGRLINECSCHLWEVVKSYESADPRTQIILYRCTHCGYEMTQYREIYKN